MNASEVACPIPPVKNEVREGVIVYTVPEQFHAPLAKVMIARRVLNARAQPPGGETYFQAMQRNESEYVATLSEMRSTLRVPDEALFEFYSDWRFSITTLENEKILHEQELAKKKPEEKSAGSPTDEHAKRWPDPPTTLWRLLYFASHAAAYSAAIRGAGKGTLARLAKRLGE